MKKLNLLIRLQKAKIEKRRTLLAPLQSRVHALEKEVGTIQKIIENEKRIAEQSIEGTMAYGLYVQGMNNRLRQVKRFLKEAHLKLQKEYQIIKGLLAQQKAYETLWEKQMKAAQEVQEKKEQSHIDDIIAHKTP